MPDAYTLLAAIYVVCLSTVYGVAYAILIQPGELLAFLPRIISKITVQYGPGTRQIVTRTGWRKGLLKLFTCGKCIAGQSALWLYVFLGAPFSVGAVLLWVGTVCAAIVLSSIILTYAGSNT